ncbi:hypothetical protein CHS0354_033757 [Potamilus streckersoni]|uniref:Uncharacterized protein n=1 Tax=Potamilus streckersoni TaxID=2493646 RepID=A0AAE0S2A0_9BIVA|nr:hypothetical protein CHS0354_033757 [Potamilus streckersoni]
MNEMKKLYIFLIRLKNFLIEIRIGYKQMWIYAKATVLISEIKQNYIFGELCQKNKKKNNFDSQDVFTFLKISPTNHKGCNEHVHSSKLKLVRKNTFVTMLDK